MYVYIWPPQSTAELTSTIDREEIDFHEIVRMLFGLVYKYVVWRHLATSVNSGIVPKCFLVHVPH